MDNTHLAKTNVNQIVDQNVNQIQADLGEICNLYSGLKIDPHSPQFDQFTKKHQYIDNGANKDKITFNFTNEKDQNYTSVTYDINVVHNQDDLVNICQAIDQELKFSQDYARQASIVIKSNGEMYINILYASAVKELLFNQIELDTEITEEDKPNLKKAVLEMSNLYVLKLNNTGDLTNLVLLNQLSSTALNPNFILESLNYMKTYISSIVTENQEKMASIANIPQ